MMSESSNGSSQGPDPVKVIHKDQDVITSFCINQVMLSVRLFISRNALCWQNLTEDLICIVYVFIRSTLHQSKIRLDEIFETFI